MKTYWDYDERERSELTEAQVNELLNVELMTQGVKNPKPPVLYDIPKSPLGERKKFFGIVSKSKYGSDEYMDPVFETAEKAQAFLDLVSSKRHYDYEIGIEFEYAIPLTDGKIQSVELYSLEQINAFRSDLKSRKAKSESNAKATSVFKEASDKAERVTEKVWEDWNEKRNKRQSLIELVGRFQEYTRMTSGDKILALQFLHKTETAGDIQQAREWFPESIPNQLETVEVAA